MKVVVQGLWHLGCVTAACCAQHHQVLGLDFDEDVIAGAGQGKAPLFEPGLDDLIADGLRRGSLSFTTDARKACANTHLLWVCYDTPVDANDEADIGFVLSNLKKAAAYLPEGATVLISSQLRVGTCRQLELEFPKLHFACSPENLRLGKAIEVFSKADRVILGHRENGPVNMFKELFAPFTAQVILMRTESAEMVKHALNSFLAVSVTFINEVARLCEHTGANAKEVAAGLKSDVRIGPRAYLGPGGPFAGGTLARDVVTLINLARETHEEVPLIAAIKKSNDQHRRWNFQRLRHRLGNLEAKVVAVLGLTYKPGTDTLRRSAAVELCKDLASAGALVRVVDPVVKQLPPDLSGLKLVPNPLEAMAGADAVVVCTEWPEFRQIAWSEVTKVLRGRLVLDANGFLRNELKGLPSLEHLSVGS